MASGPRRVVWSREAFGALDEAADYVARDSFVAAVKLVDEALELAASLATLSERGRVVPEVGRDDVRELFLHKYRLIYEVTAEEIQVVAFLHGARDFDRWLRGK
jgi:toxin ParE1/3/4